MTIKEFTESVISIYLNNGGTVHPDITLDIFKLIEKNESLLKDYKVLSQHHPGINPTMGKFIRLYFDLRNDTKIILTGQCGLIKSYQRFHKK